MTDPDTAALAAFREQTRRRFLDVDSSNVADVLDGLGLRDQALASDFRPFPADAGKLAGWAYTIQGRMEPYEGSGDPDKMRACAGLTPGSVAVWSGEGQGVCYFGELIAVGMRERGCAGAVLDGGIRDVRWLAAHRFPVYACYRTPVQSIGRWRVIAWDVPVSLRGATNDRVEVRPGDFILADDDGVIVIPAALVEQVVDRAEALGEREQAIRAELRAGLTLTRALQTYDHI
jgi:4-hydroxy-4-methyl-2-oxoglutarate aldolase